MLVARRRTASRRRQKKRGGQGGPSRKKLMAWLLGAAGSTILAMVTGVAEGVGGILLGEGGGETRESSSPTAIPTGDPIKITKITTVPRSIDGTWVHPESLDDQAVAKINREIEEFEKSTYEIMRSHGAVETGTSSVELELEGNRPTPVRITDIASPAERLARLR